MHIGTFGGKVAFLFGQIRPICRDHPFAVEHQDVFSSGTEGFVQFGAGEGRCSRAVHYDTHILDLFACYHQRIDQAGRRDDRSAVLIVVHDGYIQFSLQRLLYFEAFGCFDIFEVDPSEGRSNSLDHFDEPLRIRLVYLNVEHIYTGIYLEKQSFPLHNRLAGQSTYIPQPQNGGTIRDHGYEIALGRVFVCKRRILFDVLAGHRYSRTICQRQIVLSRMRLRRPDFEFAGFTFGMVGSCLFFEFAIHHYNR